MTKSLPFIFFLLFTAMSLQGQVQTTETFSAVSSGASTFTSNSQGFTVTSISNAAKPFDGNLAYPGTGWSGTANDNGYIDNDANVHANPSFSIKTTDATGITVQKFFLYLGNNSAALGGTGTLNIVGKNGVSTEFTINTSSGYVTSTATNNGFTEIDLSSYGGSDNSSTTITELVITTSGDFTYLAFDAFTWTTVPVDATPPVVSSITVSGSPGAADASMTFSVDFDENANNVSTDDFTVSTASGNATGTVSAVSASSGDPITVTVSSITGTGSIRLDLKASTNITDDTGNGNGTNGNVAAFSSGATHTVDRDAPSVNSIAVNGSPAANATSVGFDVTFSESVTGVGTSDFTVDGSGVTGSITGISGSGASYTVTVGSVSGTGTLSIDLNSSGTGIVDGSGNAIGGGFTAGATHTVDNDPPTISIGAPSVTDTNTGDVTYTITYSGASAVTLAAGNITLNKTGTADGSVAVTGSGTTTRTVTISSITGDGTLGISIASGTASDAAGNTAAAAGPSTTFNVDNTAPTISIGAPSVTDTNTGDVTYTITYSGASAVTLAAGNITLNKTGTADGSVAVTGSGTTTRTVTISSITGDGTLGISIASGTATDAVSNSAAAAGPSTTFNVDNTAPTISIGAPSVTDTNTGDVTYTITYSGASAVTLAAGNITLNKTGTADGSVAVTGSGTTTRTVTISSITGDGTLGISIASGTASDAAGNTAAAAGPSTTFNVDNTAPTISIGAPSVTDTNTGDVTYTITYSGASAVTLAAGNITLNKTGTADGSIAVTGSGTTTRTVTISSITGDGTLGISIASGTASDAAGNTAAAAGPSTTFNVDNTAPTISIGAPSQTDVNSGSGDVTYTITYSGASAVTLAAGNITLNKTGTADGSVAVTGSGTTTRTVTISSITGDGTLGISIASGTATDAVSNSAAAAGPSTTFNVDNTAPTISIGAPSVTDTNTGDVTYTITYSGASAVTLAAGNITLNKTGTADGSVAVTGSGTTTRTVTISSITGDGTLGISIASGTATDAVSNSAAAAGPSTTFNVDNTAPTISIGAPSVTDTNTGDVTYTITYSGASAVTLAAGNITLNKTGTADGSVAVTGSGTTTRTVTISSITGDGTLGISIASGTASDAAGNTAAAAGPSTTFNVDNTAPTISIGAPSVTDTNTGDVTYTITYSGASAVTLAAGNITLNKTGTADGSVAVTGSGTTTRTVTISSITGDGTLGISIASGTATDAVSNSAAAAGPSTTFNVDNTAPTISIGAPSVTDTNTGDVTYTITYSGASAVTLAAGNITLNKTGTADGSVAVTGSGTTTRTVTISSITGDGTLGISIASGTASDAAGNTAAAAGPSTTFNVDNTAPTISIGTPSVTDTNTGDVTYTITYSGASAVTLAAGNITLNKTGTADGSVAVTGSGTTTRTVTISSITGDGTLGISIASGTASDAAGNTAAAAGPSTTFNVDNTAPTVTSVTSSTANGTFGANDQISVQVEFSEAVIVSGTGLQLGFETGPDLFVALASGSGTNTLTFNMTIPVGHKTSDLDVRTTDALALDLSTTVRDAAGNDADRTLPIGANPNSLSSNKDLVIDSEPTVTLSVDSSSINEASGTATLTATLSAVSISDVTVSLGYTGTATLGTDYNNTVATSIVITAGNLSASASPIITVTQDNTPESNETIIVDVTGVTNGSENGSQQQTVTIIDDDAVQFSVDDPTVTEGNAGTTTLTYTVSLNNAASGTVTVDYATSDGTATAGSDYTALNTTTLTFAAGETSKTVDVSVIGDQILEGNETINLDLSNATGLSVIADAQGVGTITNDDAAAVTIADVSGAENGGAITVTASLDNAVQGGFTVDMSSADGTATTADSDYTTITSQTLTFAGTAGETQTFMVTPTADTKLEANETLTISQANLSATTLNVAISDGATVTITNDDAAAVTIADISGAENGGAITVTATLDNAVQGGFTVDVSTADGTATTADSDYTAITSQTLTFAGTAGETQTFTVTPTADTKLEADETLTVSQSNLSATTLSVAISDNATVTITNDDAAAVTIADISGAENGGAITVTATLDNAVQGGFTVDMSSADGTATTADSDYTAITSQTLTFAGTAGETQTFTVTPTADTKLEANETLTISQANLSATTLSVAISDGATVTITNDDAAAVTIADVSGAENGGAITVTATLDNAVQGGFTVDMSSADGTATTADSDYTAITSQTLTFAGIAGETQTFTVTPTADTMLEADETLTISQSNLSATTLSVAISDGATVTITNDDAAAVTVAAVSGAEDAGAITVTAMLDNPVDGAFTVDVSTADGTATLADSDYTAITSQTLTFAGTAGETQTFTVTPTADATSEGNETIQIIQSNLTGTALAVDISDVGMVTISDDDDGTAPIGYTVSFDDALIGSSEVTTSKFTFAGAEVGTTYNYTVSSDGGGTNVTGSGTITTATDQITLADLSGLSDGTLTLSVTLTDPSSNVGAAVTASTSKDATAPAAPVVSSITTDSGANGADGITNDNTLSFNGTAEANATVEVFIDATSIGTTTADATGQWSFNHETAILTDATYAVTATATDAAGNTSSSSAALSVTIDTAAPAAPVVSSITNDTGANGTDQNTNDATLSFSGTAEANATIEVFIDGTSIGTTTADGAGQWIFDHEGTTLADAVYSVTAKATDAAGNTSVESSALSVTVDTAAPGAPTIDLDAAFDTGASDSDDLTNATTLKFNGTAEANADVEVFINDVSFGVTAADVVGAWTLTTSSLTLTGGISVKAVATDQVGNTGASSQVLTVTIDTEVTSPTLSPADNATDILPTTNLVLTFAEDVLKSGNNISIRKSSDDSILESFDVSSSKVTVSGSTVTIDLENTLPPATEVYVTIGQGAVVDQAGNDYAGISNTTDWSFTTIAASVVSSVDVPVDGTYGIGDNLDFTVTMVLPVTITGTATIPVTIGSSTVNATQVGTVSNSSTITFRYTVVEDELDADGIAVGAAIDLNGGTMKDEFDVDAVLDLSGVGVTSAVLVDGVRPTPTISNANTTDPVNGVYTVFVEFDEAVAGFSAADLTVSNGTSSNFTAISNDKKWSFDITPTADGIVSVSLEAGVATDNAGNASAAGAAVTKTFDGTPPETSSITRKDADQLNTGTTSADFRVIFSEDVLGVDLTDFELSLTGTAATLNTVTQVDAKTYDVNVNGISGQGTIGLNLKDDDSILDNAGNKLGGTGTGNGDFTDEVYTTNFLPTDITSTPSSISENNAIGDVVGALTSTDADAGDNHTYTIVSGTGDTDNTSFSIDGTNLKAASVFDFETKDSYSIRVKTEDGKGGSFEKALTITIDNVLEPSIFVTGDATFDISALGLSQTRTLTVTNNGEKPVEVRITSTPAGFSVLPGSLTLTTGASADVTVTFVPTEVRNYGGNIIFNHEGGNEAHPVSGEGAIITSVDTGIIDPVDIEIYPNPASRLLTIDLSALNGSKLDITVVNATGVSMFSKKDHTDQQLTLNVSGYEMGIYIVQFTNGQSVVRKKIMIKR